MSGGIFYGTENQLSSVPREVRLFLMVAGFSCSVATLLISRNLLRWCLDHRALVLRIGLMLAVTALIAGLRIIYDVSINGGFASRASMINSMAESLAGPAFKPSTYATASAYPSVALAAHGFSV